MNGGPGMSDQQKPVNAYPYQDSFETMLAGQDLAPITITEYRSVLTDLFNYLSLFNVGYQRDHRVDSLFDRDIEQYLGMVLKERHITNGTYNKLLSHINVYFKYLFTHQLISQYPTVTLKGKSKADLQPPAVKWLYLLPEILADPTLSFYTRLTLMLIHQGFTVSELLTPGFYQQLDPATFTTDEQRFWQAFQQFIKPIQERQKTADIFLKQRFSNDPHLTLPGLHKYLKPDEAKLGMPLSPTKLYQSVVVDYLMNHPKVDDQTLASQFRLDPQSIDYYRKLARSVAE